MRRNVRRGVRRSGSGRNIGRSGVRYLWMKNVVLWTKSALMDEKRHFMDQICTLWMRIAFMDEKRRFMDQICTLWTRFALMDEKRIFYGKKIPALGPGLGLRPRAGTLYMYVCVCIACM